MSLILLLFGVGVVFLFFEVFMPGMVLGVLGAVAMLAGCVAAFVRYGAGGGLLALLTGLILLGITLYVEFALLPKTRLGKKLFLHASSGSTSQSPLAQAGEVVGQTCEALTTLAPSGYVDLAGKRYEAFSQSGFVEKGARLRVAGLDNFRLIVTKL